MKFIGGFLFILFFQVSIFAQDADFSQYYATPLSLNPALAGSFNGSYRVGGIYRDAWRAASPVPISTYVFNGEYRFRLGQEKKKSDYGSAGLRFFSDRTPLIEQNTNAITGIFAIHKSLSQYTNNYLSGGIEIGLIQKNLNYENLNFEDQFNNVNGFTGFTVEELEANNFAVFDFSLGMNYSHEINKNNNVFAGFSIKHLTNPNVSFWKNSENKNPNLVKVNRIPLLINLQLSSKNQLNYRISAQPRIITQFQGTNFQIFTGSTFRYDFQTNQASAFHAGGFVRLSNSVGNFGLAHIIPFVGFEVNDFLFGISYDVNTRDLVQDFQGMGALEISFTYTGEVIEDSAFCPQF